MTTPDFIVRLREHVGHEPLWLSGVSAVVVRRGGVDASGPEDEVLVVRRADDATWEPVAGVIEPGEHPATAAVREVAEEAGIEAEVERVAGVDVTPPVTYPNGDVSQYLTVVLRLRVRSGTPRPVDGEATEARWLPVSELDALEPPMPERKRRAIDWALRDDERAAFRS